jgi:ABC-2 type transport system permease protein
MQAAALQEMRRGGFVSWLSLVLFVVRIWWARWTFFLANFLLDVIGMFTGAAVFYLMGQFVARGANAYVAQYGLSYGSYIITGVMFNQIMGATITAYHQACLQGYWSNQFDVYLQYPGGVAAMLTGNVICHYLVAALNTLIYLLVGVTLFHVSVDVANLPDVLVILLLAVAAITGLGLAGASTFTLLNSKRWSANPVQWLVEFGVTLLAGVYFPPTVLPQWLQRLGYWLPQTHALRAARLCLSGKASLGDPAIAGDLLFLIQFTAVALPIGVLLFAAGMRKAQRDGSLTRWS